MIDANSIAHSIQTQIDSAVDRSIRDYVENIIKQLSLDDVWITKIENQINASITQKFARKLSLINPDSLIQEHLDAGLERYFARTSRVNGIVDRATSQELTVDDGKVTVNNSLLAGNLQISTNALVSGTLEVRNLVVRDTINGDNRSWRTLIDGIAKKAADQFTEQWRDNLVEQIRQNITEKGIDLDQVTVDGEKLLSGQTLAAGVRHSNLTSLGTLSALQVTGDTDLHNSLSVRSRRVGINTQHPDMALSIWDEEVAIVLGKHREQTAYLGTIRPQRMVIGINRGVAIDIDEKGQVTIPHLSVGRHKICHEAECPNYSGTKGDIVFNSNPKNDGIWGWQCLGAFRWIPLRTA
jgi:hypothetical protein